MTQKKQSNLQRARRIRRVRAKIFGTAQRPRLTVYRSNQHIYLQVVDDEKAVTLAASSDKSAKAGLTKTERSVETAKLLVAKLKKAKIKKLAFDRGGYKYHGRIKAAAETLREQGIEV